MNKIGNEQVENFTNEAKRSMEESVERMSKGLEDVTQFGQDNVEALVDFETQQAAELRSANPPTCDRDARTVRLSRWWASGAEPNRRHARRPVGRSRAATT